MARQVVGSGPVGRPEPVLLLLLGSASDERAEQIRLGVLRTFGERLASAAGWRPDDPDAQTILLRAQIVLAVGLEWRCSGPLGDWNRSRRRPSRTSMRPFATWSTRC